MVSALSKSLRFFKKKSQYNLHFFWIFRALWVLTFVEYILPILFIFFDRISSSFLLDSRIGVPESSAGMIAYSMQLANGIYPPVIDPLPLPVTLKMGGFSQQMTPKRQQKKDCRIYGFTLISDLLHANGIFHTKTFQTQISKIRFVFVKYRVADISLFERINASRKLTSKLIKVMLKVDNSLGK